MDEEEVDRISALPDDLIVHILSFMPMKFAIQTDILSKRWRHLWKFNPVLDFQCFPTADDQVTTTTTDDDDPEVVDYGFVNRCLSLHKAPIIQKLTIITSVGRDSPSNPDFENWVDFATSKHVRFLEFYWLVRLHCFRGFFKLPNSFFYTESLEQLVLSGVDFNPPPPLKSGFRGFVSLKKLTLFDSKLTDKALEVIMSTCLLLESLAFHRCTGLVNAKISGMALKEFVCYGQSLGEVKSLELDAPNLVTLKIWRNMNILRLNNSCCVLEASLFDSGACYWGRSNVRILLDQLAPQVEVLATCDWFLKFVIKEYYWKEKRCTIFKNLKEFYFVGTTRRDEYNMVMFFAFLEDCPILEKIKIDFRMSCWNGMHHKLPLVDCKIPPDPPINFRGVREFLGIKQELPQVGLLHQLKSIELLYFSGYDCEMELVKLLLEKTTNLDTLSLLFDDYKRYGKYAEFFPLWNVPLNQREFIREQVCLFTRASPHAQILFI